jgi:hypothetical protein
MLYSLFVLLVGLAAVSGFGSIPTGRYSSTSTSDDEAINLAAESAGGSQNNLKMVRNPRKDDDIMIPAVDVSRHCKDLASIDHCTMAPVAGYIGSSYCGIKKTEAACGNGNLVFRDSDNSAAWDLCGWDENAAGGKGKCTPCGISFLCHPKCLLQGADCEDGKDLDGDCFPFTDWPSPPPAPAPDRRLAETSHDRDKRRELRDKEEYEFNSMIRRELNTGACDGDKYACAKSRLPAGHWYGQCDGCPAALSTTLANDDGESEKAYQCAPGINESFYELQVNSDMGTITDDPNDYNEDERGIPFGNFKVKIISCDLGSYQGIDGSKLIEVKNVCEGDLPCSESCKTDCKNKYLPTQFSKDLVDEGDLPKDFYYNPVGAGEGKGNCRCTVKTKPDDPATRSSRNTETETKSCKARKESAFGDVGLSAPTTGTKFVPDPFTGEPTTEVYPDYDPKLPDRLKGLYDCTMLRSAGGRSSDAAGSDCMIDMTNDITIGSRTIGSKRGNQMQRTMKCAVSIWIGDYNPTDNMPQQNADCVCSKPRTSEVFNSGTKKYEGRARTINGMALKPGDLIPNGECIEVMPYKTW